MARETLGEFEHQVLLAILQLGAIMVAINTWATRRELEYMLGHSDTSVLICQDRFLGSDYLQILAAIEADGENGFSR